MDLTSQQLRRFWTKVQKTESCWLWTGSTSDFGHGTVRINWRLYRAHRVSWALANGPVPEDSCVLHRCDVPACVNPAHLFLGSKQDNTTDMMNKGRNRCDPPKGEAAGSSKLSDEQVLEIRRLYREHGGGFGKGYHRGGITQSELARRFGISQTNVSSIVRKETWSHK